MSSYQLLDHNTHVLVRPDSYIGCIQTTQQDYYGAINTTSGEYQIVPKSGLINSGLHHLFIEILSNATDNFIRSKDSEHPQTKIKVNVSQEGKISVWNDGLPIPIEINEATGLYNPELIFGHLLSGSNFDDTKARTTSGRNGVGSTVTNIFSREFTVRCADGVHYYEQTWTDNMTKKSKAILRKNKMKGFVEISFLPDFQRFGEQNWNEDMRSLLLKDVLDTAMITGIQVLFNDNRVPIKSMKDYAQFYEDRDVVDDLQDDLQDNMILDEVHKVEVVPSKKPKQESILIEVWGSSVVLTPNTKKRGRQISFVNSQQTPQGGCHVDAWMEAFLRPVLDKINKDGKNTRNLTLRDIKPYFNIYLVCTLENPQFTSQDKVKLYAPNPPTVVVEPKHILGILKFSVMSMIRSEFETKDYDSLKKVENKNKSFKKIEKYDRANLSGGKKSQECFLLLTEGDSAKTFAISGMASGLYGKKGRDHIGVFALRGVVMNVMCDKKKEIKNKELTNLIQILNLKQGLDYTLEENFKTLNYGHVVLLTDADCDGQHIGGLITNFFHCVYPSLLQREKSFLLYMRTPILRMTLPRNNILDFYNVQDYNQYCSNPANRQGSIKYYKGLGTSTRDEAKDLFGKKMIEFVLDEDADLTLHLVFDKKMAGDRKNWIQSFDPNQVDKIISEQPVQKLPISDFLNKEMIYFSLADNRRSIPSLVDGLKESQRKILYGAFLKNLTKEIKVAQLSGYIAEHTGYHHGENSLQETIVKLAQDFIGSNNIPLFTRGGQFGSLNNLGDDSASARYIFTALEKIAPLIYSPLDNPVLTQLMDDGDLVEWKYFVPILPMILVNGAKGIGTGFSTDVPLYNPKELIELVKLWLDPTKRTEYELKCTEILPWYRNFSGSIVKTGEGKYLTSGMIIPVKNNEKDRTVRVSCLPVNLSIESFKDHIDTLLEEKKIKGYKNYSSENTVHFEITLDLDCKEEDDLTLFRLTSVLTTTNLTLFDKDDRLKKYSTIQEILNEYCQVRYDCYHRRKTYQLEQYKKDIDLLSSKKRFLMEVLDKQIVLDKLSDEGLSCLLLTKGYRKEDISILLDMNIRSFTRSKMDKLDKEIEEHTLLKNKLEMSTVDELWNQELDKLTSNIIV